MAKSPPVRVDPVAAADNGRSFEGTLPVASMPRLSDMLFERSGEARFVLTFGRQGALRSVHGSVAAELTLECQCCLSAMRLPVASEFSLGIVSSLEQGNALPESLEPLIVGEDGVISIGDLIEDELILAIPHVPQHRACAIGTTAAGDSGTPGASAFGDLSSLIKLNKPVG